MVAIYTQTDKLMLKQMLDETSVGYYSLASSVNTMWVFVLSAIIDSIYPTIMILYKSGEQKAFERKNIQMYSIVIYVSFLWEFCMYYLENLQSDFCMVQNLSLPLHH